MSDLWDAPNQQVVRPDGSPPWQEGDGASQDELATGPADLDAMTKDELLAFATDQGLDANASMTKVEIRAVIDSA